MCSQTARPRFARLLFISLLALTACVSAQIQPPPGWTVQSTQGAILLNSPSSWSSPSVVLALLLPRAVAGPAESWFALETIRLSQAGGQPVAATNVMRSGQLLIRVVQIQTRGETQRAVFYSYAAAGWQQIVVLIIPARVADSDPRLETADRYVQILAARRIDLGGVLASVSAGPQFVSPGIPHSASPVDQLQRSYDQAESLQRFQNNMTNLTINQMRAMSPHP